MDMEVGGDGHNGDFASLMDMMDMMDIWRHFESRYASLSGTARRLLSVACKRPAHEACACTRVRVPVRPVLGGGG